MSKILFKTRLPREAWALAAVGLLLSITSSLIEESAGSDAVTPVKAGYQVTRPQEGVVSVALPQDCPDFNDSQKQQRQ
jgi:hypothetical protein